MVDMTGKKTRGDNLENMAKYIRYALEYARTGDTIQASVNAGFYKSRSDAIASKNYAVPFNNEIVQTVLSIVGTRGEHAPPSLNLDTNKKADIHCDQKFIKSYKDNSAEYGYRYRDFLYEIMDDRRIYTKDRLTALELLVKIESGYYDKFKQQKDKPVLIVQDDIISDEEE